MISYHPDTKHIGKHSYYGSHWIAAPVDEPERIAKAVAKFATSPCSWRGGVRSKKNFLAANWVCLDFDDGAKTVSEMVKEFSEYTHVLGTSKNHQREKKGKPACDRFHLYFKLAITIENYLDWEACVRFYVQHYQADRAAADAGRFFSPCREVISVVQGKDVPIRQIIKSSYAQRVTTTQETGLPRWVNQLLKFGPSPGVSRNTTCYKVAVHLLKAGFTEAEVLSTIMNSAIPVSRDCEVEREVRYAIRSAVRSV